MSYSFEHCSYKSNEKEIRGSLYLSPNSSKWIIFSHGFTGHRIGPGYLFVFLARKLASKGLNILSFDFSGCGESEGQFCDMTIESLCCDLKATVEFVRNRYNPEKLTLLGHSFGGMISAIMANELSADGAILLAPVADVEKHVLGYTNIFTGESRGDGTYAIGPFTLKMKFLESFKNSTPIKTFCENYKNPSLLIQGECDETITKDESYLYIVEGKKKNMNLNYVVIKNSDHSFSDVDQREFLSENILSWIKEKIN